MAAMLRCHGLRLWNAKNYFAVFAPASVFLVGTLLLGVKTDRRLNWPSAVTIGTPQVRPAMGGPSPGDVAGNPSVYPAAMFVRPSATL